MPSSKMVRKVKKIRLLCSSFFFHMLMLYDFIFINDQGSSVKVDWFFFELVLLCRVDEDHHPKKAGKSNVNANGSTKSKEECSWGRYARRAVYALKCGGHILNQVRDACLIFLMLNLIMYLVVKLWNHIRVI